MKPGFYGPRAPYRVRRQRRLRFLGNALMLVLLAIGIAMVVYGYKGLVP